MGPSWLLMDFRALDFGVLLDPFQDPFGTLLGPIWHTFEPIWDPLGSMGPFGTGPGTHGPVWTSPRYRPQGLMGPFGTGPVAPFGPIGPSGPQ